MSIVYAELARRTSRRSTPATPSGFQGFGQIPGSVALAVNAVASGAADYVVVHRALHNPRGQLPRQPDDRRAGLGAVDRAAGLLRPARDDRLPYNEYCQRYGATPGGDGGGRGRGAQERRPDPVVVLARQAADRARSTSAAPLIVDPICRFDCDIPVDGVADVRLHLRRARPGPARIHRSTSRATPPGQPDPAPPAAALAARRHHVGGVRDRPVVSGRAPGVGPGDVDLPQVYDGFSPFVWFWLEVLGFCPVGEAHRFVQDGGIDSDRPGRRARAVRRRRARQRPHARRAPDARVLPAAVGAGRGAPARAGPRRRRLPLLAALRRRGGVPERLSGAPRVARWPVS